MFGAIEIGHQNALMPRVKGSRLSPYMREKTLYIGQEVSLENASEVLHHMLGVQISDTTIHREIECYGAKAEQWIESIRREDKAPDIESHEVVYCEADASMILTREKGWKEVKLGRIFRSDSILDTRSEGCKIRDSTYVGRLGTHLEFINEMDQALKEYVPLQDRLVFISDGAPWIKNWVTDMYPDATQILDYYHAVQHLGTMAEHITSEDPKEWIKRYADMLLKEGVDQAITSLKHMPIRSEKGKQCKEKLLHYFEENAYRMDYPTYDSKGYYIGSGAIESAHRTVVQKRLKLSGQRWTIGGAQKVLNLRVINMSGNWDMIADELRKAA